ncbi:Transmembrane domain-containing protein [Spironucleus salmonicida]|uniref:Transmembrane domain-containing protein n=2 Tax=Spironucleus salmonicida TaxID=348837 RepID=A0A9P8RX26_9EUKA|nr:Transmembrane domain-containing protein [Spironucleus salmonicida]
MKISLMNTLINQLLASQSKISSLIKSMKSYKILPNTNKKEHMTKRVIFCYLLLRFSYQFQLTLKYPQTYIISDPLILSEGIRSTQQLKTPKTSSENPNFEKIHPEIAINPYSQYFNEKYTFSAVSLLVSIPLFYYSAEFKNTSNSASQLNIFWLILAPAFSILTFLIKRRKTEFLIIKKRSKNIIEVAEKDATAEAQEMVDTEYVEDINRTSRSEDIPKDTIANDYGKEANKIKNINSVKDSETQLESKHEISKIAQTVRQITLNAFQETFQNKGKIDVATKILREIRSLLIDNVVISISMRTVGVVKNKDSTAPVNVDKKQGESKNKYPEAEETAIPVKNLVKKILGFGIQQLKKDLYTKIVIDQSVDDEIENVDDIIQENPVKNKNPVIKITLNGENVIDKTNITQITINMGSQTFLGNLKQEAIYKSKLTQIENISYELTTIYKIAVDYIPRPDLRSNVFTILLTTLISIVPKITKDQQVPIAELMNFSAQIAVANKTIVLVIIFSQYSLGIVITVSKMKDYIQIITFSPNGDFYRIGINQIDSNKVIIIYAIQICLYCVQSMNVMLQNSAAIIKYVEKDFPSIQLIIEQIEQCILAESGQLQRQTKLIIRNIISEQEFQINMDLCDKKLTGIEEMY